MGEIADMIIEGILCESCGEYIGEPVGYPRECSYCRRFRKMPDKEELEGIKIRNRELKEAKKYVKDNIHKLTEYQLEKYKKSGRYPLKPYNYKDSLKLFNEILQGIAYKDKSKLKEK